MKPEALAPLPVVIPLLVAAFHFSDSGTNSRMKNVNKVLEGYPGGGQRFHPGTGDLP